jgi:serpin B
MLKVLHVAGREARRHAEYHKLLERWNASAIERGYEFRVANRLWVQEGLALESDYRALTSIAYGAELGAADFADEGEAARAEINRWVAERTNDRIKQLLAEPLDRKTRLVLANAIYFKGDWSAQFDTAMTQPGAFAAPRGIRTVPFMHQARSFRYYEDASMQALELPYKGGELAMLVLLPRPTFELARIESAVSPPSVAALRAKLALRDVSVYLPKFRMETASRLETALAASGMKLAFGAAADFSGIAPEPGLSLSAVVHKAFVDVGEEGTEAAAATAAAVGARSFTRAPDATVFRADRPFLFMICDNRDGGIIFLGRLTSPGD